MSHSRYLATSGQILTGPHPTDVLEPLGTARLIFDRGSGGWDCFDSTPAEDRWLLTYNDIGPGGAKRLAWRLSCRKKRDMLASVAYCKYLENGIRHMIERRDKAHAPRCKACCTEWGLRTIKDRALRRENCNMRIEMGNGGMVYLGEPNMEYLTHTGDTSSKPNGKESLAKKVLDKIKTAIAKVKRIVKAMLERKT